MHKIATLCEFYGVKYEPHSFGGAYTQMANLHVMLSIEHCDFFELPLIEGKEGALDAGVLKGIRIDEWGYVKPFDQPGLGLEIDWDMVKTGESYRLDW